MLGSRESSAYPDQAKLGVIKDSVKKEAQIDTMIAVSKALIAAVREAREAAKAEIKKREDEATAKEDDFLKKLEELKGMSS